MLKKPFFSIITVTLNHINGLKRTHDSLQKQDFKDYEWIVIDGLSHDGTQDFLKKTQTTWISEHDGGIYDAMNKGIERANGEYLLFMNAGDCLAAQNTLSMVHKHIESSSKRPDFIYGDALEGQYYKSAKSYGLVRRGMFTHHQAMFYRRAKTSKLRYDTAYKIAADYKFTAQFLRNINCALYIPESICIFESGGISQTNVRLGRVEQFKIRQDLKINSTLQNIAIYAAQTILRQCRQSFPTLYWKLRG